MRSLGFTPRKKAALTTEQKVARAQKAAATRAARGTKGKVQKTPANFDAGLFPGEIVLEAVA